MVQKLFQPNLAEQQNMSYKTKKGQLFQPDLAEQQNISLQRKEKLF